MADINVKIRMDTTQIHSLAELASKAEASGLKIRQKIDELGVITGSIADNRLDHLRNVRGVKQVEAEDEVWAQ